jgi:methylase of polypeptide subunit release factors
MNDLPFRVLDDDAFARLRDLFGRHGFTAEGVSGRVGVATLFDFKPGLHARAGQPPETTLDALVRLFMDSEDVPASLLAEHLDDADRTLLEDFGLLARHPHDPDRLGATVLLYPTGGPLLISDRSVPFGADPDRPSPMRPDAVYPSLTGSARTFLRYLPTGPVGDYLELCSGTGIAALTGAAAGAERAWAVDITSRSTAFAAFNAKLNGLEGVHALEGDLWAPVAGRRFDIVVAHPPFVPATESELIYRDGGEDGEHITRAILAGLVDHLADGGVFQCTCAFSARRGRTAPQRVRDALGPGGEVLDLLFLRHRTLDIEQHFGKDLRSDDPEAARRSAAVLEALEKLEFENVYYSTIVLRKHGEPRSGITVEVEPGEDAGWPEAAWALALRTAAADPGRFVARLLDSTVRLSPHARLEMTYLPGGGSPTGWSPQRGRVRVDRPCRATVEMGWNDAVLLAGFDGTRTLGEHIEWLQADGHVPAAVRPADFARGFAAMVLAGVVESSAYPMP